MVTCVPGRVLHRHGKDVRRVVPDQLQRLGVFPRDDAQLRILLDGAENVPLLAIDLDDQRGLAGPGRWRRDSPP
jgi:hypothetical protein